MHVALPKFRFPISENAWPVIFLSFVHLTTSQGAWEGSKSPTSRTVWLNREDWREWGFKKAGEVARGESRGEGEVRA